MDELQQSITVDGAMRLRRIDRYLADQGRWGSRARVQKLIAAGRVCVDGEPVASDSMVRPGQVVSVRPETEVPAAGVVAAEAIPLQILFEDDAVLVLDKPAGLVVHPAAGNRTGTLVAGVIHHWKEPHPDLDPLRPGLVHRLDKDTSGVLVLAKTPEALAELSAQFQDRTVSKQYVAFVHGRPASARGVVDAPVGRHPVDRKRMAIRDDGRPARTRYEVVAVAAGMARVHAWPETGRTHQIRVHLASLGTPIVGDAVYGKRGERVVDISRQALHAARLTFRHPTTGESMTFEAPLPEDLRALAARFAAASATRRSG